MKVTYDPKRDGLHILFRDAPIAHSVTQAPGLILDYDNNGAIVGLELTQASECLSDPANVEFQESSSENAAISPSSSDLSNGA